MRSQSGKSQPDAWGKQNLRKLNKRDSSKSSGVGRPQKDNYVRSDRYYGEGRIQDHRSRGRISYGYHEDYDEGQAGKNDLNSPYYEKEKDQDYDTKTGRNDRGPEGLPFDSEGEKVIVFKNRGRLKSFFQKSKHMKQTKKNQTRNTNRSQKDIANEISSQPSKLEKFFTDQLKDIYYAEQKILQSLPKMKEAATTDQLKDAFEDHLKLTQKHVKRLVDVFNMLNLRAEGKVCEAIEGITKEAESIINETDQGTMTRDAALIMAAQKVEHYEIATYGGLVQFAITLGLHEIADILDRTLTEEEDTDALLTEIAENDINLAAEHEENEYSWEQREAEAQV